MARVTFVDAIDIVKGALDSIKDGQAKRARLVCKWHYWGEKWIDEDGSKVHLVYTYHFHEGEWAEGATRNREMIKAAQRMAHDIERVCYHPEEYGEEDREQARIWQQKYAEYRATFAPDRKDYKHFYGWMYTDIYRGMRREAEVAWS
ncbi:MAG: hypothetical protein J5823_07520 [Paludibacteraceae bacterium]|nr:hypothetical protein [Paludibacteraceae bacterium]